MTVRVYRERELIEDIRIYARSVLPHTVGSVDEPPLTRDQYVHAVRAYAVEKHGTGDEVRMHAERTARHLWDSRPRG